MSQGPQTQTEVNWAAANIPHASGGWSRLTQVMGIDIPTNMARIRQVQQATFRLIR